jgi:hypothetical protein
VSWKSYPHPCCTLYTVRRRVSSIVFLFCSLCILLKQCHTVTPDRVIGRACHTNGKTWILTQRFITLQLCAYHSLQNQVFVSCLLLARVCVTVTMPYAVDCLTTINVIILWHFNCMSVRQKDVAECRQRLYLTLLVLALCENGLSTCTTLGLVFTPAEAFTAKMCVLVFFQRVFYLLLQVSLHFISKIQPSTFFVFIFIIVCVFVF